LSVKEHPAIASLIQLAEENPLPLAKQHFAVYNGNRYRRLAGKHLLTVCVPVDELILLEILGPHRMVIVLVVRVLGHDI
jgi:hypothetical protein